MGEKKRLRNLLTLKWGISAACWFQHDELEQVEQVRCRGRGRERKGKAGRHTVKVEWQQPQLQFESFLIPVAPESFQRRGGTEWAHIRWRGSASIWCACTTGWAEITLKHKLSQETFSPAALLTWNSPTKAQARRQITNWNANKVTPYLLTLTVNVSARTVSVSG